MKINTKILSKNIILTLLVVALSPIGNVFANSDNWGLSYPTPGETPIGNKTAEYLQEFDAYFIGNTSEKKIYLTFDAGYEGGYTSDMLDILKKHEVPATFFLVGTYIRDNQELVSRMVDEGHIVANHTMSHPDMSAISSKDVFIKELSETEDIYETATGSEMPKYYRPPRGKYSESNMKMAQDLGYKTIFWSLAYVDWHDDKQPTKDEAFSKLMPRIHPGAILLLHNTSKTNSLILEELIIRYREMGYEFGSLENLVKD